MGAQAPRICLLIRGFEQRSRYRQRLAAPAYGSGEGPGGLEVVLSDGKRSRRFERFAAAGLWGFAWLGTDARGLRGRRDVSWCPRRREVEHIAALHDYWAVRGHPGRRRSCVHGDEEVLLVAARPELFGAGSPVVTAGSACEPCDPGSSRSLERRAGSLERPAGEVGSGVR